jgi:hypothetical protein
LHCSLAPIDFWKSKALLSCKNRSKRSDISFEEVDMSTEAIIEAKLPTKSDLEEFIRFLTDEMGGEPANVDWESFTIEFNLPSYGDRLILLDFLSEKGADIIRDGIIDDF